MASFQTCSNLSPESLGQSRHSKAMHAIVFFTKINCCYIITSWRSNHEANFNFWATLLFKTSFTTDDKSTNMWKSSLPRLFSITWKHIQVMPWFVQVHYFRYLIDKCVYESKGSPDIKYQIAMSFIYERHLIGWVFHLIYRHWSKNLSVIARNTKNIYLTIQLCVLKQTKKIFQKIWFCFISSQNLCIAFVPILKVVNDSFDCCCPHVRFTYSFY